MTQKPILFDVTQLLARSGSSHMTGIDRVERAWLNYVIDSGRPVFYFLERRHMAFVFGPGAGATLHNWVHERHLAKLPPMARRAMGWQTYATESDGMVPSTTIGARIIRRIYSPRRALRACLAENAVGHPASLDFPDKVTAKLASIFPGGAWYVNVGQRTPFRGILQSLESAGIQSLLMIHDTIPLEWPQHCVEDAPLTMENYVRNMARYADIALCNSQATADDYLFHARRLVGQEPKGETVVAHLGLHAPKLRRQGGAAPLPASIDPKRPFFTILGTIEPRKNHAFLLDVWHRIARQVPAERMPQLVIAGAWGWRIKDFKQKLDASPLTGKSIIVLERPDDATMGTVLAKTQALLMPSVAEGYGLPVLEAAREGIEVIAPALPVYREIAGDYPRSADIEDPAAWMELILSFDGEPKRKPAPPIPTWADHFAKATEAMDRLAKPHPQRDAVADG